MHRKWFALVAHWWFALRCVRVDVRRSLCVCVFSYWISPKFNTHVLSPRCYYCYFSRSVCHSHISTDIKMTTTKSCRTIQLLYKRKWWWCFDKKSVKQINGKRDARTTKKMTYLNDAICGGALWSGVFVAISTATYRFSQSANCRRK